VVYVDTMAVDESCNDLAEDMHSVDLDQATLLVDIAEQLAALDKLHDEIAIKH